MPSLLKSTAILAFARTTNFALVVFSPIILVRILDPTSFGQYREFMVFVMLITSVASFNIKTNLLFFIPRDPPHTKIYVGHTTLMTLIASVGACLILLAFRNVVLANTSFDFFLPLILYVFLFLNLNFLESYWLAEGQPNYVMYFSIVRTIVRLGTVIGVAILTKSVFAMAFALCAVEAARFGIVALIMARTGILEVTLDTGLLRKQLSFVVPLSISGTLNSTSQYIGQVAVSMHLGVISLGIYTIANFQVPILNIVRGAVGDSIFPSMVRQAADETGDRMLLWKRANVAYTSIIIPYYAIVTWYADVLIPWIFTDDYSDSVPLFRVLALVLLTQCFEFSSPLRAISKTGDLLAGTALMLITNILFIVVFFVYIPDFAIFGPAVGVVAANVIQTVFYGWRIVKFYDIRLRQLVKWRSLAVVVLSTLAACVPLVVGEFIALSDLVRVAVFSVLFGATYYAVIRFARLEEVETVVRVITRKLKHLA